MYLDEIYLENTGPISKLHVHLPFADDSNPRPIVVVGPNGSGKSIFLSYIVDALMEFAKTAFRDIVPSGGLNTPYFRIIHPRAIRSGESFSLSLLRFKTTDSDLHYCEKAGQLDPQTPSPNLRSVFAPVWNWQLDGNHKQVSHNEEIIKDEMQKGVHVFFPAGRREDPDWFNPESLTVGPDGPAIKRFNDRLAKPLRVETCTEENIRWILDVFLDSLVDPGLPRSNLSQTQVADLINRQILRQARQNVERILQTILQDHTAELRLNFRNLAASRLSIQLNNGQMIPTLQSLSEGQSQLFNLFTTIIRYGEWVDINRSIQLSDITGLVLIDEIDAHLHASLQYEIVPQLIKLFPKVQFIVSSHSPLFLLGMEEAFGQDEFTILELPTGSSISGERFSEFGKAFEYYQITESFKEQIEQRFMEGNKPLVLTEGTSDVRYIHTALTLLGKEDLLNSFDIEPVGMEGGNQSRPGGASGLNKFRNVYESKASLFHRPILLLYDCDTQKPNAQIERLWVRLIPRNDENAEVTNGIENLFPANLFEDRFYHKSPTKGDGGYVMNLDKNEFCNWICEERKNANDFEKFDRIVDILEEFIEAHQSLPVQQG
jgi:hypothetical protein